MAQPSGTYTGRQEAAVLDLVDNDKGKQRKTCRTLNFCIKQVRLNKVTVLSGKFNFFIEVVIEI